MTCSTILQFPEITFSEKHILKFNQKFFFFSYFSKFSEFSSKNFFKISGTSFKESFICEYFKTLFFPDLKFQKQNQIRSLNSLF